MVCLTSRTLFSRLTRTCIGAAAAMLGCGEAFAEFHATSQANCEIWLEAPSLIVSRIEWSGPCAAGKAEGSGNIQYVFTDAKTGEAKTSSYEGDVRAGKRDGTGTYLSTSGNRYEGQWRNDKRNGEGASQYVKSGDRFEGEWRDNKREGFGTYIWANGEIYSGGWHDDKRNGEGTNRYTNGDQYSGNWRADKRHGEGLVKYGKSRNSYDGEWRDDKRTGTGTYTWADGVYYTGGWLNGQRHGPGTLYYTSGKKIVYSDYISGKKHGQVTTHYTNGDVLEQLFDNGVLVSGAKFDAQGNRIPSDAEKLHQMKVLQEKQQEKFRAAIENFRFAKDTCGAAPDPNFLSLDAPQWAVDRFNADLVKWRTCHIDLGDQNTRRIRDLVVTDLGGTWQDKNGKIAFNTGACRCNHKITYLFNHRDDLARAVVDLNNQIVALIQHRNQALEQNARAQTYDQLDRTMQNLEQLRQQNQNNVWQYYRPQMTAPGQLMGGTK